MTIVMRWKCCRRCSGVGTKLATLIANRMVGGDNGLPCRECRGEGVRRLGVFVTPPKDGKE